MDEQRLQKMYDTIRKEELRNDKTGQYDDKAMVDRIMRYILKEAKEEVDE